jgi:hypothetical protein
MTTRSQRALAATQRPAPPTGPSASAGPTVYRPPEIVERAAALDPVNQSGRAMADVGNLPGGHR